MGNCISSNNADFVHVRVKEKGNTADLWVGRDSIWTWNYDVHGRTEAESRDIHAKLERKMQVTVGHDPRFADIPPDRLKRHFAKYNRQYDSQGRVIVVGPPRPAAPGNYPR